MKFRELAERPLLTSHFTHVRDFSVESQATYIFVYNADEPRSLHVRELRDRCPQVAFLEITFQDRQQFGYRGADGSEKIVVLRSPKQLAAFWEREVANRRCYLDMTAMTHSVWAPLVKSGLAAEQRIAVVYVEPLSYKPNEIDDPSGEIFRLSKLFEGLAPLPGFFTLEAPPEEHQWFVPLLGFEGRRFSYAREMAAPVAGRTVPVIGVPGYRPEFVGFAYHGNQQPLTDDDSYLRVRFVPANCPFSVYHLLSGLLKKYSDAFLRVATIGTKPHSLGAILFALAYPERVEILYDHPVIGPDRTAGSTRVLVYEVSLFFDLVAADISTVS